MNAYTTLKFMMKYKRKSKEEILSYMDAYLIAGKITQQQYDSLNDMLQ